MMQRNVLAAVQSRQTALLVNRCFTTSSQTLSGQRKSIFSRAWEAYSSVLYRRPLTTKASVGIVIFFTSDSATQYLTRDVDRTFTFDLQRALSGSVFGFVASVFLHSWWGCLESIVGARLPIAEHRLANTMAKVLIDQGMAAPFYIYSYYVVTNFLQMLASQPNGPEAKSPQLILQETHTKASDMLWPTMLRHWRIWPLLHSFNFYFVPLNHRVLVQNLVLVGWSGYLSHLNSGGLLTPKKEIENTDAELLEQR